MWRAIKDHNCVFVSGYSTAPLAQCCCLLCKLLWHSARSHVYNSWEKDQSCKKTTTKTVWAPQWRNANGEMHKKSGWRLCKVVCRVHLCSYGLQDKVMCVDIQTQDLDMVSIMLMCVVFQSSIKIYEFMSYMKVWVCV